MPNRRPSNTFSHWRNSSPPSHENENETQLFHKLAQICRASWNNSVILRPCRDSPQFRPLPSRFILLPGWAKEAGSSELLASRRGTAGPHYSIDKCVMGERSDWPRPPEPHHRALTVCDQSRKPWMSAGEAQLAES